VFVIGIRDISATFKNSADLRILVSCYRLDVETVNAHAGLLEIWSLNSGPTTGVARNFDLGMGAQIGKKL